MIRPLVLGTILLALVAWFMLPQKQPHTTLATEKEDTEIKWYTLPDGRKAFDVAGQTLAFPPEYLEPSVSLKNVNELRPKVNVAHYHSSWDTKIDIFAYLPLEGDNSLAPQPLQIRLIITIEPKPREVKYYGEGCNNKDYPHLIKDNFYASIPDDEVVSLSFVGYCATAKSRLIPSDEHLLFGCKYTWSGDSSKCKSFFRTKDGRVSVAYEFYSASPYSSELHQRAIDTNIEYWREIDRQVHDFITSSFINYQPEDWK